MSVREMRDVPVRVIEQLVKINSIHANRYVRELLARAETEEKNMAKADITSHYQDARLTLDNIHRTIGVCFCAWMASKPAKKRLMLKVSAMTAQEKACLLEAILEEPTEEPADPLSPDEEEWMNAPMGPYRPAPHSSAPDGKDEHDLSLGEEPE